MVNDMTDDYDYTGEKTVPAWRKYLMYAMASICFFYAFMALIWSLQ